METVKLPIERIVGMEGVLAMLCPSCHRPILATAVEGVDFPSFMECKHCKLGFYRNNETMCATAIGSCDVSVDYKQFSTED